VADSIRVLIVDDDPLVRVGLTLVLGAAPEVEIVGEAGDGAEAIEMVRSLRPDVVLMDIRMPRMDGLAATEALRRDGPEPAIIALTTFDTDENLLGALRRGANGFLLKDIAPTEILNAVRRAAAGESILAPAVVPRLIEYAVGRTGGTTDSDARPSGDRDGHPDGQAAESPVPITAPPGRAPGPTGRTAGSSNRAAGSPDHVAGSPDHTGGSPDHTGGSPDHTGGSPDHTGGSTDHAGGSTDYAGGSTGRLAGLPDPERAAGSLERAAGRLDRAVGPSDRGARSPDRGGPPADHPAGLSDHAAGGPDRGVDARRERAATVLRRLSPREREVAEAVATGRSNAEISADLHMSVPTVKAYVSRVLDKVGCTNRVQIAILIHEAR
jgi:DNA-binding NarL/FixJ family response regulator